jgi:uncharacterized protein YggT (Ycf19 family)
VTDSTQTPEILPEDSGFVKFLRVTKVLVWLVWAYFVFVVIILTFGFFLLLFGANPDNSFVEWVYRNYDRVMDPFRGIFPAATTEAESIVDLSAIFAIIVYGIFAMLIHALVEYLGRRIASERSKAFYMTTEEQRRTEVAARTSTQQTVASAQQTAASAQQTIADEYQPPPPAGGEPGV